ncbi:hypothetical protein CROQUDRAFT_46793, partial [Cronartium quercuum f. sp. fusiforme G11]
CSDSHTAANNTTSGTNKGQDHDSGIFACTCHHNIPLCFTNMYQSGKKLHYLVAILDHLMMYLLGKCVGVLYDIVCHLEMHILKVSHGSH